MSIRSLIARLFRTRFTRPPETYAEELMLLCSSGELARSMSERSGKLSG